MANLTLSALTQIEGFQAAALIDAESGLALIAEGSAINIELADASNTKVLDAKRQLTKLLNLNDDIEDILITLNKSYHFIRPLESNSNIFLYLVANRSQANLAIIRHQLKVFEKGLDFS